MGGVVGVEVGKTKKGGGGGSEGGRKRTSDGTKDEEGQRAAFSCQLFKHIPPCAETLQSVITETSANITKTNPETSAALPSPRLSSISSRKFHQGL